jgi:hypothetical protein
MSPTKSQARAIRMIENNLGIVFIGKTRRDAHAFISIHIEASKNARIKSIQDHYSSTSFKWRELDQREV